MQPITAREATAAMLAAASPQPAVRTPLATANHRVLAEDIVATIALPPWTNAGMDGYAVRREDVAGASANAARTLRVAGAIPAGDLPPTLLDPGTAMRIFTGAQLPDGADSVVRQEDTDRGDVVVRIFNDRDAGANVRPAGGDVAAGTRVLNAGTNLGPHQLALLAALGESAPLVHRQPRVAIITTGNELVSLEQVERIRRGERLADVNAVALSALVEDAGGTPEPMGIARDSLDAVVALVRRASDADLIITVGGVSVGDHDHVHAAFAAIGAAVVFDRVLMRPGGPTSLAVLPDGRPWLALPGNPVSAMVAFELFGRPAVRRMAGSRDPGRRWFDASLASAIQQDLRLEQFIRVQYDCSAAGPPRATPTGAQGSGMLMSMVRAEGLVAIAAGATTVAEGSVVRGMAFGAG